MLKAKYENQDITLDLYSEWMIRTGRIGNTDSKENIQITLNENEFTSNIQSIELFDTSNDTREYSRSIYVAKNNLYSKPIDYTSSSTFARYDYR